MEFELEKTRYLKTPDANLLLYSMTIKNNKPIVVTEETKTSNDNKIFKKIPENCKEIGIHCCTLPVLLKEYFKIYISALTQ